MGEETQDSRLLYYLIREIKTWRGGGGGGGWGGGLIMIWLRRGGGCEGRGGGARGQEQGRRWGRRLKIQDYFIISSEKLKCGEEEGSGVGGGLIMIWLLK